MALSREPRNLKKLKAIRRAEFRLRQRLEYIDWEEDELSPEIAEFEAKARLPELPEESIIVIEYDDEAPKVKPRASRQSQ